MPKPEHGRATREPNPAPKRAKLVQPDPTLSASLRHSTPGAIVQRALAAPQLLRPADLMALQRTHGNRAVGTLLGRHPIHAKLIVNAPGDRHEREADRVAEQVMRMPARLREELEEDEKREIVTQSVIQRSGNGISAGGRFEQELDASRGQGQPLPSALLTEFEAKFGADFSAVRVHVGSQAERIGAIAFTVGTDIYFAPGRYQPDAPNGQQLLGHELTHVVQQRQGRVRNPLGSGLTIVQDTALEAEADRLGQRAAAHRVDVQAKLAPGGPPHSARTLGFARVAQPNGLTKLAEPQVFTLPPAQTSLQTTLAAHLEAFVFDSGKLIGEPVINLGTIELPLNLSDLMPDELINEAELSGDGGAPIGVPSSYADLVAYAKRPGGVDLRKSIVTNVLNTLEVAGQMKYLRRSRLSDQFWKILVDVHYYRDRPKSQLAFHKDTIGDTLFVNLNFITNSEIPGPEYILNPRLTPEHEADVKGTLPQKFRNDLASARKQLPEPTEIRATRIPANGIVSFVDELIHHTTPHVGHRTISSSDLGHFLKVTFPNSYPYALAAHEKHNTEYFRKHLWGDVWKKLIVMVKRSSRFDATEIEKSGLPKNYVDQLFEGYSERGFRVVAIKHGNDVRVPSVETPIRDPTSGAPRLKREMSRWALANNLPAQVQGKRRFFRTWVRAVRRSGRL